jgi:hypothetical protein
VGQDRRIGGRWAPLWVPWADIGGHIPLPAYAQAGSVHRRARAPSRVPRWCSVRAPLSDASRARKTRAAWALGPWAWGMACLARVQGRQGRVLVSRSLGRIVQRTELEMLRSLTRSCLARVSLTRPCCLGLGHLGPLLPRPGSSSPLVLSCLPHRPLLLAHPPPLFSPPPPCLPPPLRHQCTTTGSWGAGGRAVQRPSTGEV